MKKCKHFFILVKTTIFYEFCEWRKNWDLKTDCQAIRFVERVWAKCNLWLKTQTWLQRMSIKTCGKMSERCIVLGCNNTWNKYKGIQLQPSNICHGKSHNKNLGRFCKIETRLQLDLLIWQTTLATIWGRGWKVWCLIKDMQVFLLYLASLAISTKQQGIPFY